MKMRTVGTAAVLALGLVVSMSATAGASSNARLHFTTLDTYVAEHGSAAARHANPSVSTSEVAPLATDGTVRVDGAGHLLYVEEPISAATIVAPTRIPRAASTIPLTDFATLNSRPGSQRTIFLDFDGHTVPSGTYWDYPGSGNPTVAGNYPAFTTDANTAAFSDAEKRIIIDAWAAIAEDYAMFDVNVTTQDPGDAAIDRTGASDLVYGTRALITEGTPTWNASTCGCGGIAYLDVFDIYDYAHAAFQPAFAFVSSNYMYASQFNGKLISEVVSHEVGHNLGLSHDGGSDGSYFLGQRDGQNWAPIMGAGYYNGITQWSNGDYRYATNREDDLAIIAASGVSLIPDEPNASIATAIALSATPVAGLISSDADVDYYQVAVTNGVLGVNTTSPTVAVDLDVKLTVYDSTGLPVFSNDPLSTLTDNTYPVAGMTGTISADLPNGTYYIALEGTGRAGSYSGYGSVGSYTVSTVAPAAPTIPQKGTPTISGKKTRGSILTLNTGTWTAGTVFTQQWYRAGVAIPGATGTKYTLTALDANKAISARLVATNGTYRASVRSTVTFQTAR